MPAESIVPGLAEQVQAGPHLMSNHRIFQSSDIDQTREHIARTYCPHGLSIGNRSGQLGAWLNHKRLSQLGIGAMAYGTEVQISRVEDKDFLLLMLPLRGAAENDLGGHSIQTSPGHAVVTSTRELEQMRWSADCVQLVVQISSVVLDRHVSLMTGRGLREPLRFAPEMNVAFGDVSWWQYVAMLIDELSGRPECAARASIAHLETMLVVKLLETQNSNYFERLKPQSCRIAPQHVRRVERFIVDNVGQPISLEQLVEVGGVSARALFDGFKRFRGCSPMAYLRSVRLERVRQDLLCAREGETVTTIACRWGFYQFGRFAGQYRQTHGELPSETLRRGR
jgi:AraC-like DNA-binding protein